MQGPAMQLGCAHTQSPAWAVEAAILIDPALSIAG